MESISINQLIHGGVRQLRYSGFYDWFCKDSSLRRRAESFIPKLKFLIKEGVIDGDNMYVWFKNNCPIGGQLYDDMRFSDMTDDNLYYGGIVPRKGYDGDNGCEVWWFDERKRLTTKKYDYWSDLKKAIKNNEDGIKDTLIKMWKENGI